MGRPGECGGLCPNFLAFAADWFHTETKRYIVLPAGLDAAAPNGKTTMDNLAFIKQMLAEKPTLINQIGLGGACLC